MRENSFVSCDEADALCAHFLVYLELLSNRELHLFARHVVLIIYRYLQTNKKRLFLYL